MTFTLPVVDDTAVWDAWLGQYQTPAIHVALELGLFESLREPADTSGLVSRTAYSERGLSALLGMLKSLGFVDRHDGIWQLNPLSRAYMLKDSTYFWGPFFKRAGDALPMCKMLLENVRDDKTTEERPAEGWEAGHIDEATARSVTDFMHCHSIAPAVGLARTCDFSGVDRVLDVGGGSGCYSIALADANPELKATVMDLPTICAVAGEYIENAGLSGRVDARAVDMFRQDWPTDYDCHFFANVFHDWSMQTCLQLARSSFAALPVGGRICLQEMLLDDSGDGPAAAIAFSLLMCLGTKGQQFTFVQLKDMLETAGFSDVSATRSYGYYSLVTGYKR